MDKVILEIKLLTLWWLGLKNPPCHLLWSRVNVELARQELPPVPQELNLASDLVHPVLAPLHPRSLVTGHSGDNNQ